MPYDAAMRFTGKVSFVTKKDGSLFARAVYREGDKPKQVWKKVTGKKSDAKDAVIKEIERRLNKEQPKEKTFRDLAEYYRQHHCVQPRFEEDVKVAGKKSYKIMLLDVGLLEAFFKDKPLKEITRDDIQRYKIQALDKPVRRVINGQEYFKKRALATVHHHLRTLRSMFGVAYDEQWIDRIPSFRELVSAASETKRESIPTREEFERLLNACTGRPKAYYVKAVMLMIADIGARPIEIWNLKWSDVDGDIVVLTSDKGKRRIRTPKAMTPELKAEIGALPKFNEYVFGGIKSIKNAWKAIQKKAGCNVQLYDLRHLYASRLKAEGYDAMDVMKAMRHTRLATTDRYVKVGLDREREIAQRLSSNPYLPIQESDSVN